MRATRVSRFPANAQLCFYLAASLPPRCSRALRAMSEIKKAPLVASHLQRAALTAGPQSGLSLSSKLISGSVVTSSSSPGAALKKPAGVGTESSLVNPSHRPVRKQANPVKQTVVVTPSSTSTVIASATNPAPRTTKFNAPPPPPLIPTVPRQQLLATCSAGGGGGFKASLAVRRPVPQPSTKTNNATNATPSQAKKPETAVGASSESSSEYSSSDSSDTSGEEDHTKKKLEGPPSNIETPGPSVVAKGDTSGEGAKKEGSQNTKLEGPPAITATPGPSGFAKRGRGRPRLSTSTPRPAKQVKPGGQRAKSTPRKKSDRVPKPPVIFSPDTAAGKAALPKRRGRGCGGCMGCMRDDCGKCNYCKDKTKFGGPGKKKQRCLLRVCSNFVSISVSVAVFEKNFVFKKSFLLQVKPVYGKTRPIHPGSPPSEIAVIPVTKLASSLKVAEVIEQLRQNLTASIPQVIDKDSLPGVLPTLAAAAAKATSFIISQPQQLKTTPSAIASVSETKIVGPVIPPTTISKTPPTTTVPTVTTTTSTLAVVSEASKPPESKKQTQEVEAPKSSDAGKKEEVEKTPVAVATKAPDTSKAPEVSKSSEIALRTRRKVNKFKKIYNVFFHLNNYLQQQQQPPQQQQAKETVTSSAPAASTSGEDKVKCIVCGRERKPSLMRSSQFCTQRCINSWTERNGKGAEPQSSTTSSSRRSVETPMEVEKPTPPHQPKKLPRALKNLKIDMACESEEIIIFFL